MRWGGLIGRRGILQAPVGGSYLLTFDLIGRRGTLHRPPLRAMGRPWEEAIYALGLWREAIDAPLI